MAIIGLSCKIKVSVSSVEGNGLFATEPIAAGEIILDLRHTQQQFISREEADRRYAQGFDFMIQVAEDRFAVTVTKPKETAQGYLNHSCNPNCGIRNTLEVVAMRDIKKGEELTFDYAMSESTEYTMPCKGGSMDCRGTITGTDWQRPELQKKYRNYFSKYLLEKMKSATTSSRKNKES